VAIALKGSTSQITTGSTTEDITLPGTPATNDIIIVALALDSAAGSGWVNTSGYASLHIVAGLPEYEVYWKRMGATPDTVVNVTAGSASRKMATVVQTWSGVDTTTAIDATATTASGASGDPDPPAYTNVTANAMRIIVGGLDDDSTNDYAAPSGYSNLIEEDTEASANQGATVMMASKLETGTTSDDPAVFSGSGDDEWVATHFALRPVAGGGGTWPHNPFGHPLIGPFGGPI